MDLKLWKKIAVALALCLLAAVPAMAQTRVAAPPPPTLGVGVGLLKWSDFDQWAKGIVVDFAQPIGENNLSIIGDFFLGKDGDETDLTVGGGVRYTVPGESRVKLHFQAQLGVARWSVDGFSDNGFFVAPGVGARVPINEVAAFRAQADFFMPNWDYGNLYRLMFGVDINLTRQ